MNWPTFALNGGTMSTSDEPGLDWSCEAGIGVDDTGFAPVIIKCGKPARLRGIAALCDDCWARIQAKWRAQEAARNNGGMA